jgi:membrane-bound lytic murein transglycosylase MltF
MTTQNYLVINQTTNIVDDVVVWDGNTETWTPPTNSLMLVQSTTPTLIWTTNENYTVFTLTEQIGAGQIGFTWDGTVLTTNQPKPQPAIPTT